jgi:16S rRNA (guanine(1405)-N(7))-methyltransferase
MNIDDMVSTVLSSKKYASIDPSVVRRICMEMAPKYPKNKEAIKAVKNELHIIYESFLQNESYKNALTFLSQLPVDYDNAQLVDISMQIMQSHMSTKERLSDIREVCSFLSCHITKESSVMDIGCGFNPFVLPLLPEFPEAFYAYDISSAGIDILNRYFALLKRPRYKAELLDAAYTTPQDRVDVVLLLKLLPLLQQQKKGRGFSIIEELYFKKAIVSFPIKSLGGKQKGMEAFYSKLFEENLPSLFEIVTKQTFSNEMFYIIQKKLKAE